jgi:hypothetical protein
MTLQEIKDAVNQGKNVYVGNKSYMVVKDVKDQWFIKCLFNNYFIGLTWRDGETVNGKPEDFFTDEEV